MTEIMTMVAMGVAWMVGTVVYGFVAQAVKDLRK